MKKEDPYIDNRSVNKTLAKYKYGQKAQKYSTEKEIQRFFF